MRKLLNNPWVVLGLCSVAVVILYFSADEMLVQNISAPPVPSSRASLVPKVHTLEVEPVTIDPAELNWPTTMKRDPFAPVTHDRAEGEQFEGSDGELIRDLVQLPPLALSAVALRPAPRVAMINRKILTEGDVIEGLQITRIESDGVWLDGPSGSHRIGFQETTVQSRTVTNEEASIPRPPNRREEERQTRGTRLIDGRDCSRSAACS